jgi:ribosomal protein L37AE/L43A
MASPLVGKRAGPCPKCGSAEVYLRADSAPQCKECKWTGVPRYDSKFLQSWSSFLLSEAPKD